MCLRFFRRPEISIQPEQIVLGAKIKITNDAKTVLPINFTKLFFIFISYFFVLNFSQKNCLVWLMYVIIPQNPSENR